MTRVVIENRFRQFGALVQREIIEAVDIAAEATAEGAKGVSSIYNIGPIVEKIRVHPARPSKRGISAVVESPDFRSWWFERGTYLDTQEPRVLPQRFMRKGLAYGRKVLAAELTRRLR